MVHADRFLKACRGEPTDAVPVWFMRQAGRFQPEYRRLRRQYSLLEIAQDPALATDVTCRPVEQFGVDAAILFSDIMVPLGPIGVRYEIREGIGPVVADPIRSSKALTSWRSLQPERDLSPVLEAIERITARLGPIPLIGFAGGPFTLASYLVEGRPSRQYVETKRMMWSQPAVWSRLMGLLAEVVISHVRAQVQAGARAIQIFDSWVGALARDDFERWVLPTMRHIFGALEDLRVPRIYFGVDTATLLEPMAAAGPDVIGMDWRIPLSEARRRLPGITLQGNLDPVALLAPWDVVAAKAQSLLASMQGDPAYVFNLGHGILPETHPDQVRRLVQLVHGERQDDA